MIKLLISRAKQISKEQIEDEEELQGYIRMRSPFNYMSKHLKIAMFFSSDPAHAGGVQEHVFYLSKELEELGHKIDIFGPENNILPYKNYRSIARTVKLPVPNGNSVNITLDISEEASVLKKVNFDKYDLIHIHEPYVPFINWEIIKNVGRPKVATFHASWDDGSIINFINPFVSLFKDTFSNNFRGAIFVSKICKKRWQYLCRKNVFKKTIYNAVDSAIFKPGRKIEKKIINLLFVGRLVNRKGLIYLLKAVKRILTVNHNIKLVIIGDGPERSKSEKYVKKNNLGKFIEFKGEIFGKERINYYQRSDIFCAPYTDEAFGITILEALSCGVPVVGFKNEAFSEILKGYPYPKLFVKNKNFLELSLALNQLISDRKKRKEIGIWGIEKVIKFNWTNTAKETEELYYQILNKSEKYS